MTQHIAGAPDFNHLGLAPSLLAILVKQKFITPTPIQHQAIPPILQGKDIVGIAQTGTGKTLAFALPMIQRLGQHKGQSLILVPTRDLALQVEEVFRKVGSSLGLKTAVVIGGASMNNQTRDLRRRPHVIIATPGRLIDHLQQKTVTLNTVKIIVLDEADRMFDIGFMPQIKKILEVLPKECQTLLFSATMPPAIGELAVRYMRSPFRIEVAPSGETAANVEQELFIVWKEDKMGLLKKILTDNPGTVLIFSRTKYGAKKITSALLALRHKAVEIHSNRSLAQRRDALDGFKSGKYRILVATDIASRGIDVVGISLVINFDLPEQSEDYVHRIGRTGRADRFGKAISFVTPDQHADVKQIEKLIRQTLRTVALPAGLRAAAFPASAAFDTGDRRSRRPRGYVGSNSFRSAGFGRRPGGGGRRRGR
ncbi:DEAD/DEAH box helicase [Candidatus Falkowbacteria bacterium]|nr:DEAD/DEAH box helicase [Candidatus Falkowbacteria bacterium]